MDSKTQTSKTTIIIRIMLISCIIWLMVCATLVMLIHRTGTIDQVEQSDAIIVLGAGLTRNGNAGRALIRRTEHAVRLWHEGYAETIICTGGIAPRQTRSEASACREILLRNNVPASAIFMEEQSRSTEENAIYSEPILSANNLETVILVSDSYHLFRANYIFETVGIDVSLSPVSSDLIRGFPTYESSLFREILALHWQVFKTIFNIPITHFP